MTKKPHRDAPYPEWVEYQNRVRFLIRLYTQIEDCRLVIRTYCMAGLISEQDAKSYHLALTAAFSTWAITEFDDATYLRLISYPLLGELLT